MGKIKDMFATQIKEFGKYEKKKIWLSTEPKFIRYNIGYGQIEEIGLNNFDVSVTNLLNIADKSKIITNVNSIDEKGLILSIKCPVCGKDIELNRHWNAYLCFNSEHGRMIFEISNIEYERPKQIMELEEEY